MSFYKPEKQAARRARLQMEALDKLAFRLDCLKAHPPMAIPMRLVARRENRTTWSS